MKKNILYSLFLILLIFVRPVYAVNNSAIYYYNKAIDNYKSGKTSIAVQNYKKAIALNPKFTDAYYNLAVTYYNMHQTNAAITNLQKVLSANPNYPRAKLYLKSLYFDLGCKYQEQGKFDLALQSYNRELKINPKEINAYKNMAIIYDKTGNKLLLIETYKKIIDLDPTDANVYFDLGYSYSLLKQYDLAILNYRKALELNPNFAQATHNLEIASRLVRDNEFVERINQEKPYAKAPTEIYDLVKLKEGVKYITLAHTIELLDFLWSDREGRILLTIIKNNRIPINITLGENETNATTQTITHKQTISLYGIIPLYTFDEGKDNIIEVNVGEQHINAFRNTNLSSHERIYAFMALAHELSHATKSIISKNEKNSIQEEITVSMIGYNIASRIFNSRDLTTEEAVDYSKDCLKAILTDNHKFLPLYSNITNEMQKVGIYPPYPYLYQSIPALYKSIRDDENTIRFDKFENMIQ